MSVLKDRRAQVVSASTATSLATGETELVLSCPGLVEMISSPVNTAGEPRLGGSLTIYCTEGQWRCVLKDKDQEIETWASASSLSTLLTCLESGLQADTLTWRLTKVWGASKPRRTKK